MLGIPTLVPSTIDEQIRKTCQGLPINAVLRYLSRGGGAPRRWLTGWSYRKSHIIKQQAGAGTNYQKRVTVFHDTKDKLVNDFYGMSDRWTSIEGNPTDRHALQPVHRSNIVEVNWVIDGAVRKYLAYDSDNAGSQARLYYTNDLDGTWTPYSGNPVIAPDIRWPSVVLHNNVLHMIANRPGFGRLDRWTSVDGINWTWQETVVPTPASNPYLWLNPNDNKWYLYWYRYLAPTYWTYCRVATTIAGLATAGSIQVKGKIAVFAGPSVMYVDGQYWLFNEVFYNGIWMVTICSSLTPTSGFVEISGSPFLTNNEACAIAMLSPDGSKAYLFSNRYDDTPTWRQDTREIYIQGKPWVECGGKCQSDFRDIRFVEDDVVLKYWIEEKVDDDYAIVWFKVNGDLSSEDREIYFYYGNPVATSLSNGDDTFLFFDDFSESIDWVNKWQSTNQALYSIENGKLRCLSISPWELINPRNSFQGFKAKAAIRQSVANTAMYFVFEPNIASYTGTENVILGWDGDTIMVFINGGYNYVPIIPDDLVNYYTVEYRCPSSGYARNQCYNIALEKDVSNSFTPQHTDIYPSFFSWVIGGIGYVDYILVGKYVDPEPQHGSWGSEEAA